MKIHKVRAVPLRLHSVNDSVDGTQDNLLIRVETDEGLVGYGEVDSSPGVIAAVVQASMSHGISYGLADILVGRNPLDIAQLWDEMYRKTVYHGRSGPVLHAMSGVEMALWDIAGKIRGEPIHQMLGACYREKVLAYASALMPDSAGAARDLASEFKSLGFRAMKFGWGPIGRSRTLDRDLFEAVRQGAGPDVRIMIDAGQVYRLKDARRTAELLHDLDVYWLEEPLDPDDLDGYAQLSQSVEIWIAAGEAESGFAAFRRLIGQGMVDIIQPDLSRAGGILLSRAVAQMAEQSNRRVIPHAFKSNLLLAASLHFCAATRDSDMIEYSMSTSPIRQQLTRERLPVVDGYVEVPKTPGLGVEVDEEVLRKLTII
jgi:L-rhamnonate dehydratase